MKQDEIQPAAYDAEGRPLYASPEDAKAAAGANQVPVQAQVVHVSRALDPVEQAVPPEIKRRHDESVRAYPELNLSEHEYIVSAVPRHFLGLLGPLALITVMIALVLSLVFNYPFMAEQTGLPMDNYGLVLTMGLLLVILFALGGYAAVWIYLNNRFFLTNESVIQEIQTGLFSHKEQTVSLANIEDASYDQVGFIQTLFNYGSIRLSTEGDETTYRFRWVDDPKYRVAILNNAVEAFKNGRPVGDSIDKDVEEPRAQNRGSSAGVYDDPNDD